MVAHACIVATGARTPIGLRSATSAAALRAGIMRVGEHPFMFDGSGEPLMCAMDPRLDPALLGPARLSALVEPALREATEPMRAVAGARARVPVYLGLPERRPGFQEPDAQLVLRSIAALQGLPVEPSQILPCLGGHAAGLSALADAVGAIARGTTEICLVGGVESYLHLDTIEALGAERQLACPTTRSGFIPGEGAGFCLLMATHVCRRLRLRPLARVSAVAVGREGKTMKSTEICLGEGLDATIRRTMAALPDSRPADEVICDINGERYRNEEWGFVCLRSWQCFVDPSGFRSPADTWGDMGAASGPLFAMLACQAAERGYGKGPRTMVWASSEGGLRAAAVLDSNPD
jgi:3-oxoacyl-[acyl-carrier-protein] synthase-1